MKNIYIVLTYTGTILSKIIKLYTKKEYSHCSISLNNDLSQMYSFGRYNENNPFWGGFIKEEINKGTFKRFHNTKTAIYCLNVTEEQYEIIKQELKEMLNNKKIYTFNLIGLFLAGFKIKVKRKHKFYCSEFVKYLLDKAKVNTKLSNIVIPQDFANLENIKLIYRGKLNKYNVGELNYELAKV